MTSAINLGLEAMRADLSTTFGRLWGNSQCHPDDAVDVCLYVEWCIDKWRSRSAVGNRCCNMILLFELVYEYVSCAAICIPLDNEGSIVRHKLILLEEVSKGHEFRLMESIKIRSGECIHGEPININDHA